MAKMICLEKNLLSSEQVIRIDKMNFSISKKNKKYEKSEEFEKERKRIEKIIGGKEHDAPDIKRNLKFLTNNLK